MAIHDAYARFTPYEMLLPDPEFPERRFAAIAREAEERGVDSGNPAAFVMLGAVQGALAELQEDDAGPESAHDHSGILFLAYHFWRCDGGVVLAGRETVRELLEGRTRAAGGGVAGGEEGAVAGEGGMAGEGETGWAGGLRRRAGYVQLPQHLVWMESPGQPPESVDGFFWHGDENGILHMAMVAGMRRDRPGCVVASVPPQPLDAMPGWASGPAREGDVDFATSLPGAELDGLVGIRTPAEVLKLAALLLERIARERPEAVSPTAPAAGGGDPRPHDGERRPEHVPPQVSAKAQSEPRPSDPGPRPTALPFAVL